MPNLKNSLVNLTIILFSLFSLTLSLADNQDFIFPKKKIVELETVKKKQIKIEKNNNKNLFNLPQKKPIKKKNSTSRLDRA
jgi:hypothetical protein